MRKKILMLLLTVLMIFGISIAATRDVKAAAATGHQNTVLRNAKRASCKEQGYTGDTYCKDCGAKLSDGQILPMLTSQVR